MKLSVHEKRLAVTAFSFAIETLQERQPGDPDLWRIKNLRKKFEMALRNA